MSDIDCRFSQMESRMTRHEDRLENLSKLFSDDKTKMEKSIERIESSLELITSSLDRQKGFIGGVTFVVSAVFAFVTYYFTRH